MPDYTESFRLWYTHIYLGNSPEWETMEKRIPLGQTSILERAEAVEMFLVENGYQGVVIETVHHYYDGHVEDDVFNKLGHNHVR
jgi:hypothetical protein